MKYSNTGLKRKQLISPDGVSEKVYFLYRRENEPELVIEHLPFLLREWCQIRLGPSRVFARSFTTQDWEPAQQQGADAVSDKHCIEQSVIATDFISGG